MALPLDLLRTLARDDPGSAWRRLFDTAWDIMRDEAPDKVAEAIAAITCRDQRIGDLDLFLASAGWELWAAYDAHAPHTAPTLRRWWQQHAPGRAILILDALSLREVPWLLHGARKRGYDILAAEPTGSEVPAETTAFAKALGFGQRSNLENNGASGSHAFPGARTDSLALPWADCAARIGAEPDWVLWHHWPDRFIHDPAEVGRGLDAVVREASARLTEGSFWDLVERLASGRRLVITSDHGYAACGHFANLPDDQAAYMKERYGAKRRASTHASPGPFLPPLDLELDSAHGRVAIALGRRKWRSQGGYPGLTHGGLSLLEVISPWIELWRPEANG